MSGNDNGA